MDTTDEIATAMEAHRWKNFMFRGTKSMTCRREKTVLCIDLMLVNMHVYGDAGYVAALHETG